MGYAHTPTVKDQPFINSALANAWMRTSTQMTNTSQLGSGVFRRCRSPVRIRTGLILSRAFTLLQSITNSHSSVPATDLTLHPRVKPATCCGNKHTFRGLIPFSVFPATRSFFSFEVPLRTLRNRPLSRSSASRYLPRHRALHSQGFAPSQRLAPRATCRTCFIPVPLLGFYPSRISPCVDVGGPLGLRDPHDLSHDPFRRRVVSSGLSPSTQSRHTKLSYSPV